MLDFLHKKKSVKRRQKITTKHRIFGAPDLVRSKKFTQPLVVMVETFRISGEWTGSSIMKTWKYLI